MIVGLTGGIASGKTTVSRVLQMLGAAVFMSDDTARQAYFDPEIRQKVTVLLGKEAYKTDNTIDRKHISLRIFSDPSLRAELNSLLHPYVGKQFRKFVDENINKLIIKESALLFEAGVSEQCDKVIVVAASDELRISRLCERETISRKEAELRLASQMPQTEKIKNADFVLYNDEKELLLPQIVSLYKQLNSVK
jgi:dephospho-CoA kinase